MVATDPPGLDPPHPVTPRPSASPHPECAEPGIETRLETAVREAREVIADLDDTPPSNMDQMFYMQAYDDLHMHLEELLTAIDEAGHAKGDADAGSR